MRDDRASCGVDGHPNVVGLLSGGSALHAVGAATALRSRARAATIAGYSAAMAGAGALVPGLLGVRYVRIGKLQLRDRMLDEVQWRGGETVLDVGSQGGLLSIGAAERATSGRVIATDIWVGKDLSGNGGGRLQRNAAIEDVADRVEVRSDPAGRLDLPDASVDVVLSTLCLHNIEGATARRQALSEIARVRRPRGCVVISDLAGADEYADRSRQDGLAVNRVKAAPGRFRHRRSGQPIAPRAANAALTGPEDTLSAPWAPNAPEPGGWDAESAVTRVQRSATHEDVGRRTSVRSRSLSWELTVFVAASSFGWSQTW